MGRVVSAFVKKKAGGDTTTQQWTEIGKRNPQWPQVLFVIPPFLA
jgi:hypothetical protein